MTPNTFLNRLIINTVMISETILCLVFFSTLTSKAVPMLYIYHTEIIKHKRGSLSPFHCIKVGQQRKYRKEENEWKQTLTAGAVFSLGSDLTARLQFSIFFP